MNKHQQVLKDIAQLSSMTVNQLQEKWIEVWNEPCRSRNKPFLIKRIAWKIQANLYGGISERAKERAKELADETLLKVKNPQPFLPSPSQHTVEKKIHFQGDPRIPAPGTMITRIYKGKKLTVIFLDQGFEFKNKIYKSLSSVAKAITGSHWNGIHFFGLDKKEAA